MPDSGLDQVWALDAFDGSVVDPELIPNDGRLLDIGIDTLYLMRIGFLDSR